MSWLCSQALVEEYSAATSSAGAQSALSSGSPTPQLYLQPDRMTAFSRLSRSGMTCAPLTDDHSAALLTSFLAAFRARTSAPPARAQVSTARAPGFGAKWHELSVRFDLSSSSWRTHLCLWDEALPWSSVTLPRWGMTRSGLVFQHPTQERPISVTASGLWPTPTANNFECKDMEAMLARRERAKQKSGNGNGFGLTLGNAVKLWPTPTARDHFPPHKPEYIAAKKAQGHGMSNLNDSVNGQLNPDWVEWLMGWPVGWTDLKPLETARFREWQQQHSPCSATFEAAA